MDHSKTDASPHEPIPVLADADRAAAFPQMHTPHHAHGTGIFSYWLMDRLEWTHTEALAWEVSAWIGGDVRKLLLRSEGHAEHGEVASGNIEILYAQGTSAWWEVVAGVRHDIGRGPSRTWAGFGVQGVAPYKFDVSATAYLGQAGRTAARLEAEYDTLLSQRWMVQWRAEANLHGRNDAALGVGAGLSTIEAGARLRYEIDRRFAPYLGIQYARSFGRTADYRRAQGHAAGETHWVVGVRCWL